MPAYRNLTVGDPAPWFRQRSFANPRYAFDTAAGRYLVLCFYGTAADEQSRAAIAEVMRARSLFDDRHSAFFGVSADPQDEKDRRVADAYPGYRFIWDFNGAVSRLYGAAPHDWDGSRGNVALRRMWVVLDPMLRVMKVEHFTADSSGAADIVRYVSSLPPPERFAGIEISAPVLVLPSIFEPDLCRQLLSLYETNGGVESGFMREVAGKTVAVHDHSHKRRRDYTIDDQSLVKLLQARFMRRVVPEIAKAHQFNVTRMERYIIACYAAEDEAHFRPHRDNTTKGTAHRRFAVSINLNDDFDGGELSFPEFGPRTYKAPAGTAVVFSCSFLHAVSKVTRGRRYAFLPFLYDDAAARLREENLAFLDTASLAGGKEDSDDRS
jgi:predicted 2-oxoglutarate/Fe(II)-dependent dioxygenase YbiX/peroxiredoxin